MGRAGEQGQGGPQRVNCDIEVLIADQGGGKPSAIGLSGGIKPGSFSPGGNCFGQLIAKFLDARAQGLGGSVSRGSHGMQQGQIEVAGGVFGNGGGQE